MEIAPMPGSDRRFSVPEPDRVCCDCLLNMDDAFERFRAHIRTHFLVKVE